jgi:hypothetical protein
MNDGHFGNLRPGTHEIEASYDDSNHESSSATRGSSYTLITLYGSIPFLSNRVNTISNLHLPISGNSLDTNLSSSGILEQFSITTIRLDVLHVTQSLISYDYPITLA